MATIYTTEGSSQNDAATNVADRVSDGGKTGAQVRAFRATRIIASDDDADVLHIIKLPEGARVIPESLAIYCEDPGTAYNIASVGDLADADRYSGATDISAGGYFALTPVVTGPQNDYKVGDAATDTGWLTATLGTITTQTDDNVITFTGQYSVQN